MSLDDQQAREKPPYVAAKRPLAQPARPWMRVADGQSLDDRPCDRGRLAAGEEPPGGGGGGRDADQRESEVEDRYVAEIAEVVVVQREQDDVGAGDAEQRAEQGERARGGRRQPAADAGGGSGRGQRAQVSGALAADQSDRQREDAERQQRSRGRRDGHGPGGRVVVALDLKREAGVRGAPAGVRNLVAGERSRRLDKPARAD